jgi:hypothetical protein
MSDMNSSVTQTQQQFASYVYESGSVRVWRQDLANAAVMFERQDILKDCGPSL